jgi:dTDP-4-dehydrorhamnose 3,5-epimerase-like enzyme
MQGIKITHLDPIKPNDPRGDTYEVFKGSPGRQVTALTRKQGQSFAGHFHPGKDKSKDPEMFFLISGEIELSAYDGRTGEEITTVLKAGDRLDIGAGVWHDMKALNDVVFIEYRETVFDPEHEDTVRDRGEYEEWLKSN